MRHLSFLLVLCFFIVTCGRTTTGGDGLGGGPGNGGGGGNNILSPPLPAPQESTGLSSQVQFCSSHEKVIGIWEAPNYSGDTVRHPFIYFNIFDYFAGFLPETGPIEGSYRLTEENKISLSYRRWKTPSPELNSQFSPIPATESGMTFSITDHEISFIMGKQSQRIWKRSGEQEKLGVVQNPFRNDGICNISELPRLDWEEKFSCPREMLSHRLYFVFPTFYNGRSDEVVSFYPEETESALSTLKGTFSLNYFDYSRNYFAKDLGVWSGWGTETEASMIGKHWISGNFSLSGSGMQLSIVRSDNPEFIEGDQKKYDVRFAPPFYMSLRSSDREIVLGRKIDDLRPARGTTASLPRSDAICDIPNLATCPASTLLGQWMLEPFYKAVLGNTTLIFKSAFEVAVFEKLVFRPDGSVTLLRNDSSSEILYYQVQDCPSCSGGRWRLVLARSREDLNLSDRDDKPPYRKVNIAINISPERLHLILTDGIYNDVILRKISSETISGAEVKCVPWE